MKFFKKFILVSLIISYSLSSLSDDATLNGIKKILDRGELVVSVTPNSTSMFTVVDDDGSISGIDRDIADGLAKSLGVKLKIITSAKDWNSVIDEVSNQKSDLGISYLSITAPRATKVLYSTPYAEVAQTIIFNNLSASAQRKKGKLTIKDMFLGEDGMTLGVYSGSSYEEFANNLFPNVKTKGFESATDMFDAVIASEVDALLIDELEVFFAFMKNPAYRLKLTEVRIKDKPDFISIAIDSTNRDLLDFVNNFLLVKQLKFSIKSAYSYSKDREKMVK
jgi:polar amino acid transport system substrate-binding protein